MRTDAEINSELDRLNGMLGGDYATGTWAPAWTNLTITGSPTYSGVWTRMGNILFWQVMINPNGGTTAATWASTYINNLPFTANASIDGNCVVSRLDTGSVGVGRIAGGTTNAYVPTWTATGTWFQISGTCRL